MNTDNQPENPRTALIKENLRRSFDDKASEDISSDLMSLIDKLREQNNANEK